jgi:hypothetical protein
MKRVFHETLVSVKTHVILSTCTQSGLLGEKMVMKQIPLLAALIKRRTLILGFVAGNQLYLGVREAICHILSRR